MAITTSATDLVGTADRPTTSTFFWRTALVLTFLKGLLLLVALPVFLQSSPEAYQANAFPDRYDTIATNLIEGHGYKLFSDSSETLLRTPGFVLVLAALFAVAGKNLAVIQAFNVAMSLLSGWGLYRLALRIGAADRTAVLAAVVFLLYPASVIAESRGGLESTFTACAIFLLLAVYRALDSYSHRDFVIVGIVLGVALLIKSTLALFLPALFIWLVFSKSSRGRRARLLGLFAMASLVTTLVMSPWIIRNYQLSGKFIPTMTNGGLAAFQGMWIVKHLDSEKPNFEVLRDATLEEHRIAEEMGLEFKRDFFPAFYSVDDEIQFYGELGRRARAEFLASPQYALRLVTHNFAAFWIQGRTPQATALNAALVIPFLAVATTGLVIAVRRQLPIVPIILLIATFVAPHLPILGVARYHTPLVPFISIFVALALAGLYARGVRGLALSRRDVASD